MNAIIVYDSLYDDFFFFPNTGYFAILNKLKKINKRKDILKNWITAFDRYFKDDVGQLPVLFNMTKLSYYLKLIEAK